MAYNTKDPTDGLLIDEDFEEAIQEGVDYDMVEGPDEEEQGHSVSLPVAASKKIQEVPSIKAKGTAIVAIEEQFNSYYRVVNNIKSLTVQEEISLFERFEQGHVEAAKRIVEAHLKIVIKLVMPYLKSGIPAMDLISEGNLGLMRAVQKFDLSWGTRFATYATWFINAKLREAVLKYWSIIKVGTTSEERRLFFVFAKAKAKLGLSSSDFLPENSIKEMATLLGTTAQKVRHIEARLSSKELAFENSDGTTLVLPCSEPTPHEVLEQQDTKNMLQQGLSVLNERERQILLARLQDELGLEAIGKMFGISAERVRQIVENAKQKVAKLVNKLKHKV